MLRSNALRLSCGILCSSIGSLSCADNSVAPNAPPPPTSVPEANYVAVSQEVTYQRILGWQGAAQIGQLECNPQAYQAYRAPLLDSIVHSLGINRLTLPLQSGTESPVDHFQTFLASSRTRDAYLAWRDTWFAPVQDNADPFGADPRGFQWSYLDFFVDHIAVPLRQRLASRGESLYITLTYVDFVMDQPKPFLQMKDPDEYAELVHAAFQHLNQKYGWVPDGFEMLLEPDNTSLSGGDIGRAMVATGDRLAASGFSPDFIAPSTTAMNRAVAYYDAMVAVPRVYQYLSDFAYHRYGGTSESALTQIAEKAHRNGIRTMMLEHIGSGYDDLWIDLKAGHNSSWMQFALAFCGNRDNHESQGVYYHVNQSDPGNPQFYLTNHAKYFRHVFSYVRRDAVRLGATSQNSELLDALAFSNTDGRLIVVVKAADEATFGVTGLKAGTYGINYTSGSQTGVELDSIQLEVNDTLVTSIPGQGLLTIYAK